jgi:RNA polymerase-associated protein CTR9
VAEVFKTNDVAALCQLPTVELEHLPLLYDYARLTMVADPAGTRKLLLHLIKHHPGAVDTFYLLHELALQEKRPREAVAWLNVLLKLDPSATYASVLLSRLYLESKASSAALRRAYDILHKSAATRKDHVMQLAKALLLLREGQRPDRQQQLIPAIQRFAEVLKDDPRNLMAAHGLACCTALRGDANEACRMLDRIAETSPNDSTSKDNALVHQLIAHIQSGNTPHAVSLAKTLRIETASIRHRSSIAYAYLCSGQANKAKEILEQARATLLSYPVSAQDEGLLSMLNYDLTIVTVCGVVDRLAKPDKLDLAKLEDMKNDIRAALDMAKVAANSNYKRDAGTSILFMNDIISQLKNLEKERLRQVQRVKRHRLQDEQLHGEWRRQAEEARAQRDLENQRAMERKEALRRARLEAANAFQESTRRMNPTQEEIGYRERDEYAEGALTPDVEPIGQGELMDESGIGLDHSLLDALENPTFVVGTLNVNETLAPETMDPINATQIGLDAA